MNFPGTSISHRTDNNFPGASIFSSNRYLFSRKPYLVLEHIIIIFKETPMPRTDRHSRKEGTARRTDISLIGLGGCFSYFQIKLNCFCCTYSFKL